MTARIVVLDGYTVNPGDNGWDAIGGLGELRVYDRTPAELVLERARGADVLVTNKTPLDAATLGQLTGLRGVAVLATGVNVVDVRAARELGIPVCNVPNYGTASVVEHTFALLLELCRGVGAHDRSVRSGAWSANADFSYWNTPQRELSGLVLGVVGYGETGSAVARVASAFGLTVLATPSRSRAHEAFVRGVDLETLFSEADVVTLHCPLTPETRELVRWARLKRMKPDAFLINTARGGLINEPDLARALQGGIIAGAALDVLSTEPPSPDNPLLSAPRCVITPHLAWTTRSARQRLLAITADNVRAILNGTPIHVVIA